MAKLKADYINWVLTLNATQAQEEFHKLEKDNKELQKQTNASRKAMAELEAQGKKGTAEWNNLRKSIDDNSKAMAQNRAKMDEVSKRIDTASMSMKQLRTRLKELKREFDNTSKATNPKRYKELRSEITRVQAAIDKTNASARGLQGGFFSLTKMKQTLIGFFNGVGLTIMSLVTGSFREAFNLTVDFEKANSKLAGILNVSRDSIKDMEAAARQLGATTVYSAAQVTGLQIELAKLGFAKEQILQMEGAVLKFAKAVDTDLSRASAFAGAALRIFNKDASETENVLATFAVATTKTALDFSKLEASLSTVGPVAYSFGLSIEDTTALLGMLANAGFDASSAATATRNIILNLCDANGDLAKALGQPVRNATDLAAGLKKLNAEGVDLAKALELTDKRSVAAFSTFLNQADNITALRDSITGVTGDFQQMSETMGDNVAGAMAGLKSAAEELVLKISSGTNGPIKDLIKALTTLVQWTGEMIQYLSRFNNIVRPVIAAFVSYKLAVMAGTAVTKLYGVAVTGLKGAASAGKTAMLLLSTSFKSVSGNIQAATKSFSAFKLAMKATPWGAVIAGITAVVAALLTMRKSNDKTKESVKLLKEAEKSAADEYSRQRTHIESLILVANNERISLERRKKAVDELNRTIPGYNAQIDATTGKYKAAKERLDEYLTSLEKEMRYKANQETLQKLIAKSEEKRMAYDDTEEDAVKNIRQKREQQRAITPGQSNYKPDSQAGQLSIPTANYGKYNRLDREIIEEGKRRAKARKEWQDSEAEVAKMRKRISDGIDTGTMVEPGSGENIEKEVTTPIKNAGAAAHSTVDEVKKLRAELKQLNKEDPKTDEEYDSIRNRKKQIRERLKELNGSGKSKSKRTPGTYSEDSLDEATASADDLHQKKLLDVNKLKGTIPEYDLVIKKNQEMIRYCGDLQKAMTALRDKTDATHTQTLDKIKERENEIAADIQASQQAISKATADKEAAEHNQRLEANKAFYETQEQEMRRSVNERKVTEEAADIYLLARKKEFHEQQLQELNDFYNKSKDADYLAADERAKLLEKTQGDIRSMTSQVLTDTGSLMEKIRELSTDTTSTDGIRSMYDAQRASIEQTYAAAVKIVGDGTSQAVALEEEKQRRIAELNYQQQEQQWQLQDLTGLTWGQEYERELAQLENYHKQGLIKEKDYQSKKLQLGVTNAKRYFDYFSGLSGSMFQAIQDAEIAMSDAKFDVLIQQAKNNGEDTAELEQQKENEKLEIQKKYADVNFAIKISQIIADTAVAIMQAFSQLGPIGGGIAAALITATGVAQVIQAKAERDKVKNMQPGNTSGSGSVKAAPKAERTLTGYSEGGYTGDGDRYEVAGVVHRGEYVVPKPIMENPRVIDAVGTIEAIRRNKMAGSGLSATTPAGSYAEGGFTAPAAIPEFTELVTATQELREAARNIRAYVVLRDIDDARESLDRARAPFTRKP